MKELIAEMFCDRVPVEQVISERVKVLPGSSEKINVMVAAGSPALRVATLLVMVTVGGRVS